MDKFSYDTYKTLVNNINTLSNKLQNQNEDTYTSPNVQYISYDLISLANSLQMYIRHFNKRNNISWFE